MADEIKQILTKTIQLADQVIKLADDVHSFTTECQKLKTKTERLAALLQQSASAELFNRSARRIINDTEQVLDKTLNLVTKCRANGLIKRMFTKIPIDSFSNMYTGLDNSIGDVSWLLRISASRDEDGEMYPPNAQNEPIISLIWEHIATLHNGCVNARADAAASLVSIARDNERNAKLIIETALAFFSASARRDGSRGVENAALA